MDDSVPPSDPDGAEKLDATLQGDSSLLHSNEQYYLEMFRRALLGDDQSAKEQVQRCLSKVVLEWIRLHPRSEEACRYKKKEEYISQTFARFWQTNNDYKKWVCNTLNDVLRYLQMSVNSVIMDTLRNYSQRPTESSWLPVLQSNSGEVWKNMHNLLPDARQQRLAYLLFHCGLKPKEIVRAYPEEFGDVQEIIRLRRSIIGRVLLNPDHV